MSSFIRDSLLRVLLIHLKLRPCDAGRYEHSTRTSEKREGWVTSYYIAGAEDTGETDPGLGGIIEEFHTCPKCGVVASRHA